ncbi:MULTISPECIES: ParB N-terminal domain-containing protein [Corynebacterium]|nr:MULTISPECIES: ParB N-terminal domain-containing protein [Corynebacterium]ANE09069.1 hypothetical protein A3654_12155 [Corynebacterium glutamicum]AST21479.1 hypothetical protein CEY17_12255 [Corynebacterium glutamicum ATCC 14067]KIH73024.1 hypothetical protein SD36_12140 [Corynebacterium glutamicum]OKX95622.1 hypothetical protein AUP71_03570 [Corynebacterium glutamicum]QJS16619.1 ParB N-terminal domain-containing protein [Corynebacterium glutamicum]
MNLAIKGNHPYADEFPMASEEELEELTASVSTVGLIHPIILTPDGLVLDGRNRLEACKRAGVEPTFETREGDDDDFKEFVIGVNTTGRRESMTVQIAAASVALILGHERRKNGRWKYGQLNSEDLQNSSMQKAVHQSGMVLDILGPAHLEEVRDGATSLNAKYEEARREKERLENIERRKVEAAKDEADREAYADQYFEDHPVAQEWLASKPEGVFATSREAYAAYQEFDREARALEEARKREEEEKRRVRQDRIERMARYLESFISSFQTGIDMADHPEREEILSVLPPQKRADFLDIETKYLKGENNVEPS